MELTFLGTGSAIPTKDRNHMSVFVSHGGEGILLDCGEGTQRQMRIAKISPTKVTKILISHWHGDHVLGLFGLINTIGMSSQPGRKLEVFGPVGTKKRLKSFFDTFECACQVDIIVKEVTSGKVFETNDLVVQTLPMKHRVVCNGYSIVEKDRRRMNLSVIKKLGIPHGPLLGKLQKGKTITLKGKKISPDKTTTVVKGKKVSFITDTETCANCIKLAKDSDVLIIESSFASDLKDKAKEYKHLTSEDAANIAKKAKVKKLVLTHFSMRYKDTKKFEKDAKRIFPKFIIAKDFMKIAL